VVRCYGAPKSLAGVVIRRARAYLGIAQSQLLWVQQQLGHILHGVCTGVLRGLLHIQEVYHAHGVPHMIVHCNQAEVPPHVSLQLSATMQERMVHVTQASLRVSMEC
jgi:hypothetical protein